MSRITVWYNKKGKKTKKAVFSSRAKANKAIKIDDYERVEYNTGVRSKTVWINGECTYVGRC